MSTVLVIEDDDSLSTTLATSLRARSFDVVRAASGELGLFLLGADSPDAVLVDLGLPKVSGIEVIKQIRMTSAVPVIVLSAQLNERTKVQALEVGADDYVTKPFGIDELVARIRAALRRGIRADGRSVIETSSFTIDLVGKTARRGVVAIKLTNTEWRMLEMLVAREGQVISHGELLREVWSDHEEPPVGYLRVYMAALRRKLESEPASPQHLLTEAGLGYRFQR